MHRRLVSVSAMVGLLGITLLGVAGASSSARALPGQPALADLLEKTVARQLGTCNTSPNNCVVNWIGAATYCQTTYGAGGPPPAPCTPAGGVPRPCGDCTGAAHVYCDYDALVLTRCCQYNGLCCPPPGGCTTNILGSRLKITYPELGEITRLHLGRTASRWSLSKIGRMAVRVSVTPRS